MAGEARLATRFATIGKDSTAITPCRRQRWTSRIRYGNAALPEELAGSVSHHVSKLWWSASTTRGDLITEVWSITGDLELPPILA
ncbi:hypothetical protein GCM10023171_30970 [Microbacterium panaciterrae]|uniref:Uncharacterized protein n=1 Tax=Microbacterium panaciterrae TaxID=985759 RepID=A0ABP8PR24_9MICO